MEINLNSYQDPMIYFRKGKKCVLDVVNNCLRPATPEEIVRQKVLCFLCNEMDVPLNAMETEVNLSHYKKGFKGRIDIVVDVLYNNCKETMLVVECKAPNVELSVDVFDQAYKYASKIGAPIIMLTNGIEAEIYVWNYEEEEYGYLDYFPTYDDILNIDNLNIKAIGEYEYSRYSYEELFNKEIIEKEREDNYFIDEDTDEMIVPHIINVAESLLDYSHQINKINVNGFELEDLGIRYTNFRNPRGAQWVGDYRYFKIIDKNKNTQLISFMVQVSSNGRSYLVAGLDDFGKHNPTLYLSLNHFTKFKNNKLEIFHNGAMTIGQGAAKRERVLDYVSKHSNLRIVNNQIFLGKLAVSDLIYVDNSDFIEFLANLIEYVLVREELKDIIRKERKE